MRAHLLSPYRLYYLTITPAPARNVYSLHDLWSLHCPMLLFLIVFSPSTLPHPPCWCAHPLLRRYESDRTQNAVARLSSALTDMSISGGQQRFGSSGRGGVVGDARRAASFSTDTLRDLVPRQKRARNSVPSPSLEDQSGKQVEEIAGMLSSQSLDGIALDQNLDEQPKLSTVVEARDSQRSSRASDSGETWDVNVFGRRPSVATALRASGAVN